MSSIEARVKRRCETEHAETIEIMNRCADSITLGWQTDADGVLFTTKKEKITQQLPIVFDRAGIHTQLRTMLVDLVDTLGEPLSVTPVAAPPYVVVGSTGPIIRAALSIGRLVVTFQLFTIVKHTTHVRYKRLPACNITVKVHAKTE